MAGWSPTPKAADRAAGAIAAEPTGAGRRRVTANGEGSVHDVIAAIDIKRLAGDQLGAVHAEEGDGSTDVVDRYQVAAWRRRLRLLQQLVEVGNARRGPGLERA